MERHFPSELLLRFSKIGYCTPQRRAQCDDYHGYTTSIPPHSVSERLISDQKTKVKREQGCDYQHCEACICKIVQIPANVLLPICWRFSCSCSAVISFTPFRESKRVHQVSWIDHTIVTCLTEILVLSPLIFCQLMTTRI